MRLLLILAAVLGGGAAQAACPAPGAAISISRDDPDPVVSAVPMAALRGQMQAVVQRAPAAQRAQDEHLGVTASRVEWRMELAARYLREPDGRVCAVADRVTIVLAHVEHAIRIAEEIAFEGCLWREVLAHEQRHATVNRATLVQAEQALRGAVTEWARRASARAADAEAATAQLQVGLRQAVEPHLAAMRRARAEGHGRIDTAAEYGRLARICPGDQRRLQPAR
ncbi:MAG: hypothetical protein V4653_15830 [Pseudomonadota bacterium]